MSRYAQMFDDLGADGAFVPFCMLGDPDPEQSLGIVLDLVAAGADALELGIPFSDPVADGPTIQAAGRRASQAGTRTTHALDIVKLVRQQHPTLPIGLLVYANLVEAPGPSNFYRRAATAGVDSVLIADVPTLEASPYLQLADEHGIEPVLIAAPNASPQELSRIATMSRGYTYVVSRAGVTGAEVTAGTNLESQISLLNKAGAPPALVGFGISTPEHVREALASGARGAICGSAIVKRIAQNLDDAEQRRKSLQALVSQLKSATLRA
jgi:tryptophan synthase alpha chain